MSASGSGKNDGARYWLDASFTIVALEGEVSCADLAVGKSFLAALDTDQADEVASVLRDVLEEHGEALIQAALRDRHERPNAPLRLSLRARRLEAPTAEGAIVEVEARSAPRVVGPTAEVPAANVEIVDAGSDALERERRWSVLSAALVAWPDERLPEAIDAVLAHALNEFAARRVRLVARAAPGARSARVLSVWPEPAKQTSPVAPTDPWLVGELQSGRWVEGLPITALPEAAAAAIARMSGGRAPAYLAIPCQPQRGECAVYLELVWDDVRGALDAKETEAAIRVGEMVAGLWQRHRRAVSRGELDRRIELLNAHRAEGYVEIDGQGRIRFASRSLERLLGRTEDSLAGSHVERIVHARDVTRVLATLRASFAGRPAERLDFRAMHMDGSTRWLEAIGTPTVDESGEPVLVSVIRDVSSRELERATLLRRYELERLIAGLTRRFLAADVEDLDAILDESLARIGDAMSAIRVGLLCFAIEARAKPTRYEYTRADEVERLAAMGPARLRSFPWCQRRLEADEIIEIPDVAGLPSEAAQDRKALEARGVASVLSVAATEGDRIAGILTVHGDTVVDAFPEDEKRLLRVLAELCTAALKRRTSEREVRKSGERFRALAENMRDSICEIGEQGRILYASPSYADLMGGSQESFVGTDPLDQVVPEDQRRASYLFRPGARSRRKGTLVYRAQSLGGRRLHLEATAREFEGHDGKRRVVVATRDVTEREQARGALDRQLQLEARVAELSRFFVDIEVGEIRAGVESRLAVVAELADAEHSWMTSFSTGAGDALERFDWWLDPEREGSDTAQRSLQSFPYSTSLITAGRLYHVPDIDSLPADARAERADMEARGVRSVLGIPIMSGGQFVGLLGFERFDREIDWSDETIVLLRVAGEIFYSTLRRRRANLELRDSEAQLLQAQKMEAVGTLAGGIAHDFNNHLAVMLGNARFVRQEVEASSDVLEAIDDFERSADHCAQLTRSLLAFSRRSPVEMVPVAVDELVGSVEGLVRPLLPAAIDLQVALFPDLGCFEVDRVQIQQVLVNLLVNARDAMPDGGPIRLQAIRRAADENEGDAHELVVGREYVVLSVEDRGVGMDEETRVRVFEPFFTTKELGSGTGLGLAMAYGIVQQTGGAITVDSAPGRGTTFRVYLAASDR